MREVFGLNLASPSFFLKKKIDYEDNKKKSKLYI